MHQIYEILSTIATVITVILGLFAAVLFAVLLYFRETKEDRNARAIKQQKQLAEDDERERRLDAQRIKDEEQAFVNAGLRQARMEEQRRTELRQLVSEEVASHFARQE